MLDLNIDDIGKQLIEEVADLTEVPAGAYNFRVNSQLAGRHTTENIDIISPTPREKAFTFPLS